MSIKKNFKGQLIRKPGSYSSTSVTQTGASELGGNETLFIIGEAEAGQPGDIGGIKEFRASQLGDLIQEYQSGPIVDVAKLSVLPSKTPGIAGAGRILVWKTNSAVQASINLSNGSTSLFNLKASEYGLGGNKVKIKVEAGVVPARQKQITIKKDSTTEILSQNAGQSQLLIQYTGADATCTATISGATKNAKVLIVATGSTPAEDFTVNLKDYSMKDLVDLIDAKASFTATLVNTATGTTFNGTDLDPITASDIKTAPVNLYRLQEEILAIINNESQLIDATLVNNVTGIPANLVETFLSGGLKGASVTSDFSQGMDKSLAQDLNIVLPAVSRDASDDIADALTDSGSTYDIESIFAALDTHLRLRGSIKNRKEAQGMVGYRKTTKASVYTQAQTTNSELIQMAMQDVLVSGSDANLSWKQPHCFAAMMAGIRLGTQIGEPLTHKFLNCQGIGHAVNPSTGLEAGDFNPNTDYEEAIDAGVTFAEQASGGFRIVVDNTTYGKDASFVWNRGSVIEAAQFSAKEIRNASELIFVGKKVSAGIAKSIKTMLRGKLKELFDANIITASDDAPQGYVEETFVVNIQGNTCKVQIEIKPVQGLDFIFIEFTLGDISQSA